MHYGNTEASGAKDERSEWQMVGATTDPISQHHNRCKEKYKSRSAAIFLQPSNTMTFGTV